MATHWPTYPLATWLSEHQSGDHKPIKSKANCAKSHLRLRMRLYRRQLSWRQQRQASLKLCHTLQQQRAYQRSQRIALYLANDGEIDPKPLLHMALAQGKVCYLPVLHPIHHGHLWFARYQLGDRLITNRYGIPEPDISATHYLPARSLDLVLLPLVAFDQQGQRLGMGGGFYDRTFARRSQVKLVGLAHEGQRVEQLVCDPWDVPLHAVATDQSWVQPKPIAKTMEK